MLLLRSYAFALIAAGLWLAIQPAAASPISTASPGQGAGQLLHLVHGRHSSCIGGHRHRWDGLPVPCASHDQDDDDDDDGDGRDDGDDDDGDDDGDGDNCIQVGPVQYCR